MISEKGFLPPKEILNRFPELKREKLAYWVDKGYLQVEKRVVGGRTYRFFSPDDIIRIGQAVYLIVTGNMKDRKAFDLIEKELDGPQLSIFSLGKINFLNNGNL